jgi:hypothetical protein
MWLRVLTAVFLLAGMTIGPARAQVLRGSDFQVNVYTSGSQAYAAMAPTVGDAFVVAWRSQFQDGSPGSIFMRRYSAFGVPQAEQQVNTFTTGLQSSPSVASDADGNFVVVWQSYAQDGSQIGVFGQRYNASGVAQGGEFRVNTFTTGIQQNPVVASDADGNFVVVWSGRGPGDDAGVFARRYDSTGAALGGEFLVNTYTTGSHHRTAVAAQADGRFMVVWEHLTQDGSGYGVYGQRFDAAGAKDGVEFRANVYTTGNQSRPAVVARPNGNFVVAWNSEGQLHAGYDVLARHYLATPGGWGPEFRLSTGTGTNQRRPRLAADARGNFVAVWDGLNQDGSSYGVFGRRFHHQEGAEGPAFQVNTYTFGAQQVQAIAVAPLGNFAVSWVENDGNSLGVVGQRFFPDVILSDGFETGDLSGWTSASTGGGDLFVTNGAAIGSGSYGLEAFVDDTEPLFVRDDSPVNESRYRARFYFSTDDFDPGEALAHRRVRLFVAFDETPSPRRLMAIVLRRLNGQYAIRGRARLDDNSQADSPWVAVAAGPTYMVELDWQRASGPTANDARFEMRLNEGPPVVLSGLDASTGSVDYVRLGPQGVKAGASGTLRFDRFGSRRSSYIGP